MNAMGDRQLKIKKKKSKKIVKSLLKDLKKASQLVDGVADQSQCLDNLERTNFTKRIAASLGDIFELKLDLLDLEPELTDKSLQPSLSPVDLSETLKRLLSQNREICQSAIKEFKSHMTEDVAFQFAQAWDYGNGYDFAENWWRDCPLGTAKGDRKKPFIPVIRVYKNLRHARRYIRYCSAKLLEKEFGEIIWDDAKADVSLEIADRWFKSWSREQKD
jgi:hypothetical protein